MSQVDIDDVSAALWRDLEQPVPRYTSYPTADNFETAVDANAFRQACQRSNEFLLPAKLSLYIHVPFCESLCYYCGCNKLVTRDKTRAEAYLNRLESEVALRASLFDADRELDQIHFGGGTPTFLNDHQLHRILQSVRRQFNVSSQVQAAIEVDPRTVDKARVPALRALGFQRFSLGVQDFDPRVQLAVNRVQSLAMVSDLVTAIRMDAKARLNFDLIYGLPHQTPASFDRTVAQTIALRPDRIALYHYAHLPQRFKAQRLLSEDRPDVALRVAMFTSAREALVAAGYCAIGLDHFALPNDDLALAWQAGTLTRNFQGYTATGQRDLIGVGPSAISEVAGCYAQNETDYRRWLVPGPESLPIRRGYQRSADDEMRHDLIAEIMCQGAVDLDDYAAFPQATFAPELRRLQPLSAQGLATIEGSRVVATAKGRLALRHIASVFDAYLDRDTRNDARRYSRAI